MAGTNLDANKQDERLLLIDCNALLYRSFFALPPLTTSTGIPTGAVYGFAKSLAKLIIQEQPSHIACAWDKGRKTFRHKAWKQYKATRPKTPEELIQQIPYAKEILAGLNVSTLENDEYEADDILATLAVQAQAHGLPTDIYTGDKDILQIVSPSIRVIRFRKGITHTEIFDVDRIREHLGIEPGQMVDYLALVGDQSDNIPGIPGIGPKTATKLLQQFGSIRGMITHTDELPSSVASKLEELASQLELARYLAQLVTRVPIPLSLEELRWKQPDTAKLFAALEKLESRDLMKTYSHFVHSSGDPLPGTGENPGENTPSRNSPEKDVWILDKEKKESFPSFTIRLSRMSDEPFEAADSGRAADDTKTFRQLSEVACLPEATIVGHDLKPLIRVLLQEGMSCKATFFDIGIAAYVLDPSQTDYSLEAITTRFLQEKSAPPRAGTAQMSCMKRLYSILKERLQESDAWDLLWKIELPLVPVLAWMELRGIRVDRSKLQIILEDVENERKILKEKIYQETGEEFNINSPQQLAHVLFDKLGLPAVKRTKTGISTSESALRQLSDAYPYVETILAYRHLTKLASTYLRPLEDYINPKTGRVHTSFCQVSTATGRLSSYNPNLQNIPIRGELANRIRSAFAAEKGCMLLSADYSQIELRILAHLSGDERLIAAFEQGRDIHQETASEIFDVLPLQVSPEMRRLAKVVNFGIIYGMSPFGLARDLRTSQEEAARFIERYFERYPGVKTYIENTLASAREKGFVSTLMGRRRYLPAIHSKNRQQATLAERIAINSPIQGTAADLIKIAMLRIYKSFQSRDIPAWIILQIHDELLIEVDEPSVDKVRTIIRNEMEQAMSLRIHPLVNIKTGTNWAEMAS